jgi:hypothetical protein
MQQWQAERLARFHRDDVARLWPRAARRSRVRVAVAPERRLRYRIGSRIVALGERVALPRCERQAARVHAFPQSH